jgi:hypothetical protein
MAPVSRSGSAACEAGATRRLGTSAGTVRHERGVSGRGHSERAQGRGPRRRVSRRVHVGRWLGSGRRDVTAVRAARAAVPRVGLHRETDGGEDGRQRRVVRPRACERAGARVARHGAGQGGRGVATGSAARRTATRGACARAVARPGQSRRGSGSSETGEGRENRKEGRRKRKRREKKEKKRMRRKRERKKEREREGCRRRSRR